MNTLNKFIQGITNICIEHICSSNDVQSRRSGMGAFRCEDIRFDVCHNFSHNFRSLNFAIKLHKLIRENDLKYILIYVIH